MRSSTITLTAISWLFLSVLPQGIVAQGSKAQENCVTACLQGEIEDTGCSSKTESSYMLACMCEKGDFSRGSTLTRCVNKCVTGNSAPTDEVQEAMNKICLDYGVTLGASTSATRPTRTADPDPDTSETSRPSFTPNPNIKNDEGMGKGAKIGIAVGAILGVALIAGIAGFFIMRRRKAARAAAAPPPPGVGAYDHTGANPYPYAAASPNPYADAPAQQMGTIPPQGGYYDPAIAKSPAPDVNAAAYPPTPNSPAPYTHDAKHNTVELDSSQWSPPAGTPPQGQAPGHNGQQSGGYVAELQ